MIKSKKAISLALTLTMMMGAGTVFAEESVPNAEPAVTLESLAGSYIELFPEMEKEEFSSVWDEMIESYIGITDQESLDMLKLAIFSMFESEIYGSDAVTAVETDPTTAIFDCYFLHGPKTITVDGNCISGFDAEGNEVFSHEYVYAESIPYDFGEEMNEMYAEMLGGILPTMDIYVAEDAEDEFKYFAFCADTPEETYHIEFRYGAEKDGITAYYDGDYAYWLAAGIPADYSNELMKSCIELFVSENAEDFKQVISE